MSSSALSSLTRSFSNLSTSSAARWAVQQAAAKKAPSTTSISTISSQSRHLFLKATISSLSEMTYLHSSSTKPSFTIRQFSSEENKTNDADAEWNKFQETLRFDTIDENNLPTNTKKRGGKAMRKKKDREMELLKKQEGRMTDVGTGQFPPLRYSDEETEKLLAEAYAALPEKGISKKRRHKQRMANRFKAIRKARHLKKQEKIAHHFATMAKRNIISNQVRRVVNESVEVRNQDLEYQRRVLKKWAVIQTLAVEEEGEDDVKQEI